ncbi:MAG TPA: lasso RiPP family leader peptide-containing protein [Candidatus Binataceae bacterium]|nr:lasso RiPP family leader peptide-containing protein [Candidatus Binataceae bacterium]
MRKQQEEISSKRKEKRAKRAYNAPRLIEFGSVTKLTAGTGTSLPNDGASGMMNG